MSLQAFQGLPEAEQDMWVDRHRNRCPQCGGDRRTCGDPTKTYYPQRSVCRQTMETEAAQARYEALHKAEPYHDGTFTAWSKTRDEDHPYKFDDGVNIWAATVDLDPKGTWLSDPDEDPADADGDGQSTWMTGHQDHAQGDGVTDAEVDAAVYELVEDTLDAALEQGLRSRR